MVKRVVLVTESFLPSLNGVTTSVLRVLDTLKQIGAEVLIIAPTAPAPTYLDFRVIRTASLPIMQFNVGVPGYWLQAEIEAFKPDVVHIASPFILGGQAIAAASNLGIPSVAIYQTEVAGYMERYRLSVAKPLVDKLVATIHSRATLNLVPTDDSARYLRRLGIGSVVTWGRGVDLELFSASRRSSESVQSLKSSLAPNGELVVGYVGRLAAEKQVERMAELADLPNVRFLIVGDGPDRTSLESLLKPMGVAFTGKLTGEDLADAYATIDVFVHFGTEETFGQTVQEAQASGCAVVAPDRGGPRHLVDSGVDGLLVNPDKKYGYREAVASLVADQSALEEIARRGTLRVSSKSWAKNNEELLRHYLHAIQVCDLSAEVEFELA